MDLAGLVGIPAKSTVCADFLHLGVELAQAVDTGPYLVEVLLTALLEPGASRRVAREAQSLVLQVYRPTQGVHTGVEHLLGSRLHVRDGDAVEPIGPTFLMEPLDLLSQLSEHHVVSGVVVGFKATCELVELSVLIGLEFALHVRLDLLDDLLGAKHEVVADGSQAASACECREREQMP